MKKQLTYSDIEPIVEYLVKVKARDNTFDCWDADDIAQEIRIICLGAIEKFDPVQADTYKKMVNYFGTCVDNRLRNLRRDKYIRFTPPFSKKEVVEIEENPEKYPEEYAKLQEHRAGVEIQKKIKHPVNIEVVGEPERKYCQVETEVEVVDMKRHLLDNIEDSLKPALTTLLSGDKRKVNIRIRRRIQASVRTILEE